MVLPHVPKEKILNALKAFDQECRNKPEWVNWQSSQMQKYALSYEGKHYPPKMIISLATGVPRNQFTGGNQSNNYLSRYGFKIIRLSDFRMVRSTKDSICADRPFEEPSIREDRPQYNFNKIKGIYELLSNLPQYNYSADRKLLPDPEIEALVDDNLRKRFTYTCITVGKAEERLSLEEGLIALFANEPHAKTSGDWLGKYAVNERIRKSGLWNSEHINGRPLSNRQFVRIKHLAGDSKTIMKKHSGRALVLIPCCKSKTAIISEGRAEPLRGLRPIREQLLKEIDVTLDLIERDVNLRGILNPQATITKAIDLYVGSFYSEAGSILQEIAENRVPSVDVLIVSAFYGLVLLNEGIKKYELQMSDTLRDGTKIYKYWQKQGLCKILNNYIKENQISCVWSLLPNSMPAFPYQQVFQRFWREAGTRGIECFHVRVPGAGSSTGVQRARWLKEIVQNDPELLIRGSGMNRSFKGVPGYTFEYLKCY